MSTLERWVNRTGRAWVPIIGFFILWGAISRYLPMFLRPPSPFAWAIAFMTALFVGVMLHLVLLLWWGRVQWREREREEAWRRRVETKERAIEAIRAFNFFPDQGEEDASVMGQAVRAFLERLINTASSDVPEWNVRSPISTSAFVETINDLAAEEQDPTSTHDVTMGAVLGAGIALELIRTRWIVEYDTSDDATSADSGFALGDRLREQCLYPYCRKPIDFDKIAREVGLVE